MEIDDLRTWWEAAQESPRLASELLRRLDAPRALAGLRGLLAYVGRVRPADAERYAKGPPPEGSPYLGDAAVHALARAEAEPSYVQNALDAFLAWFAVIDETPDVAPAAVQRLAAWTMLDAIHGGRSPRPDLPRGQRYAVVVREIVLPVGWRELFSVVDRRTGEPLAQLRRDEWPSGVDRTEASSDVRAVTVTPDGSAYVVNGAERHPLPDD